MLNETVLETKCNLKLFENVNIVYSYSTTGNKKYKLLTVVSDSGTEYQRLFNNDAIGETVSSFESSLSNLSMSSNRLEDIIAYVIKNLDKIYYNDNILWTDFKKYITKLIYSNITINVSLIDTNTGNEIDYYYKSISHVIALLAEKSSTKITISCKQPLTTYDVQYVIQNIDSDDLKHFLDKYNSFNLHDHIIREIGTNNVILNVYIGYL